MCLSMGWCLHKPQWESYQIDEEFKGVTQFYVKWVSFILPFLLLPSVNLMSLNITRIRERATEIAVRKAFGASRGALIKQLLIENIILTVIDCVS